MLFLRRTRRYTAPNSEPRPPSDRAHVAIPTGETGQIWIATRILRISPNEMRLALDPASVPAASSLQLSQRLDVQLPLPAPHPPTVTRTRLVGIAQNYDEGLPPVVLDVEFMDLTDEEAQALRESHPGLLVS